jgi:hypothetical protein
MPSTWPTCSRRSAASLGRAGRGRYGSRRGGIQQTTGDAVDLTPEELSALSEVLDAVSADEMSEGLTELHSALRGRG